jgi:hypothetical protein
LQAFVLATVTHFYSSLIFVNGGSVHALYKTRVEGLRALLHSCIKCHTIKCLIAREVKFGTHLKKTFWKTEIVWGKNEELKFDSVFEFFMGSYLGHVWPEL